MYSSKTCLHVVLFFALSFSGLMAQSSNKLNDNQNQGSETRSDEGSQAKDSEGSQGSATKDEAAVDSEEPDLAFERFSKALTELRQNQVRMQSMVVNIPIGFAEQVKAQKAQVQALKERNELLSKQLMPNAIESFEKFPGRHEQINNFLMRHVQGQLTGQQFPNVSFDPFAAKAAYERLVAGKLENPAVSMVGYRANYILNDFEAARLLVLEAHMRGFPNGQPVMDDLRVVTGQWERELAFREKDESANLPRVKMELDVGDLVFELFEDQAPNTVANFISLVESGFYNDLTFNQVSVSEVAVAGSPTDDGLGGPGYAIKDECEGENIRHHFTGVISMFPTRKDGGGSRF